MLLAQRNPVTIAGSLVVVAAATLLVGHAGCGFDATWALVWARDLLHGHTATTPAGALIATPHPFAIGQGVVASILASGHAAMTAWAILTELTVVAMFAGVIRLGGICGSYPAGWIAALIIATEPGVRDAVGRGTTDIAAAAACAWGLALATRRPQVAIAVASVAALCRPEAWLLIPLITMFCWQHLSRRARAGALTCAVAVPAAWLAMGAVLFRDSLAAVHVTTANGQASTGIDNLTAMLRAVTEMPAWSGLVVLLALGAAVGRHRRRLRLTSTAAVLLLAGLALESAGGASFVARYLTAAEVVAVPLALAALFTLPRSAYLRLGALCLSVAMAGIAFSSTQSARRGDSHLFAAQRRDMTALFSVLTPARVAHCAGISIPPTAVVPAIILAARDRTPIAIDHGNAEQACVLIGQDEATLDANGWGPRGVGESVPTPFERAKPIAHNGQWALYER